MLSLGHLIWFGYCSVNFMEVGAVSSLESFGYQPGFKAAVSFDVLFTGVQFSIAGGLVRSVSERGAA